LIGLAEIITENCREENSVGEDAGTFGNFSEKLKMRKSGFDWLLVTFC